MCDAWRIAHGLAAQRIPRRRRARQACQPRRAALLLQIPTERIDFQKRHVIDKGLYKDFQKCKELGASDVLASARTCRQSGEAVHA